MRNLIFGVTALVLLSTIAIAPAAAGERRKSNNAAVTQLNAQAGTKEEKKRALINNFNIMRNQELRVILLQQMLNEEASKLGSLQEQFCRLYNLDIQKLRQGNYRYDETQEKFVEIQPQVQQLPQAQQFTPAQPQQQEK
mgnify:CR=1 FL=1